MIFHTFGNKEGKAVLLIHGVLTPWQIWNDYIDNFKGEFFVVVPELDAHTQGGPSSFVSAEDEASRISSYIREELGGKVYLLAGLSMGGYIAATIAKDKDISIDNLVLDGAPLLKVNGLLKRVFKKNYISIIRRSKERDPKVIESAKKDFLPERYIDDYLKIADNIEEKSIVNIIDTVMSGFEFAKYPDDMRILFMHGTKGNEAISRKAALKMRQVNPQTEIKEFKGMAHGELAIRNSDKWIREVNGFLGR